jgi:hypothetical protein
MFLSIIIELPKSGIFVGLEVLPKEYYFSNKIIASGTFGKYNLINSVCIGTTMCSKKSKAPFESWRYVPHYFGRTLQHCNNIDYLINIIIEPHP